MFTSHVDALKNSNLKATPKRVALMEILSAASVYMGPREIWNHLRKRFNKLGLPTVYRNLEELVEAGIISRIIHPNRQLYYFLCDKQHHHHHFICIVCGKVQDLDFCAAGKLDREVSQKYGGKILSHLFQVNGLCGNCTGRQEDV
jgi:Fur family zinc uptake transcriptional regulator/Fur family ferric uptake transcriptional regulator